MLDTASPPAPSSVEGDDAAAAAAKAAAHAALKLEKRLAILYGRPQIAT